MLGLYRITLVQNLVNETISCFLCLQNLFLSVLLVHLVLIDDAVRCLINKINFLEQDSNQELSFIHFVLRYLHQIHHK